MSDEYQYPDSIRIEIKTGDRIQALELLPDEAGMVRPKFTLVMERDPIEVEIDSNDLAYPLRHFIPGREMHLTMKVLCGLARYFEPAVETS